MPVSDFLKEYMLKHGYTKADISRMSNIPYTTIDGLFKKGDENTKLSTLKKLAELIGCTIDDMAYNCGSEKNSAAAPAPAQDALTPSEETHIKKYRQLDDGGKEEIDDIIDVKLAKLQRKAEEGVESLG